MSKFGLNTIMTLLFIIAINLIIASSTFAKIDPKTMVVYGCLMKAKAIQQEIHLEMEMMEC